MLQESILQYFQPALSNNWSWKQIFVSFFSGPLRQVLLYIFLKELAKYQLQTTCIPYHIVV